MIVFGFKCLERFELIFFSLHWINYSLKLFEILFVLSEYLEKDESQFIENQEIVIFHVYSLN